MPHALRPLAFAILLLAAGPAGAGKLDGVREATDDGDDDAGDAGGDGDDEAAEAVEEAFLAALFHGIGEAAAERAAGVWFERYPYADRAPGWIFTDADDVIAAAPEEEDAALPPAGDELPLEGDELALAEEVGGAGDLRRASFRFSLDYAYDWGGVHRPAAALALDSSGGFGARADLTSYVERLPDGALDYLAIGTVHLAFRLADARRVAPYVGLGWRYLVDGELFRNGFSCLLAADVFPARPLVVSAIAEGGNLGAAGFFHGRVALGALVFGLELFAGYDAVVLRGADEEIVFHGPVAGIRGWL